MLTAFLDVFFLPFAFLYSFSICFVWSLWCVYETYVKSYKLCVCIILSSRCFKVKYNIKYASLPLKILATNKFIWEAKSLFCECRDVCTYLNFCFDLHLIKSSFALLRNFSCLNLHVWFWEVQKFYFSL